MTCRDSTQRKQHGEKMGGGGRRERKRTFALPDEIFELPPSSSETTFRRIDMVGEFVQHAILANDINGHVI
jgi:hypothetical protein